MVDENYGESPLAERHGIQRYPAVFVNDVLIAKPKDFGFYGESGAQGSGRYTPWRDPQSHEKFKLDLRRMIDLVLAGEVEPGETATPTSAERDLEIQVVPEFSVRTLDGEGVNRADLRGRVTVVEFWATWCPPCRKTLGWMQDLKEQYGNRVEVIAVAVESDESHVREMVASMNLPVKVVLGTPELAVAFGDIVTVPTMFVFDPDGNTASVFYGAPADLHEKAEAVIGPYLE